MIVINVNTSESLVNGSLGVIEYKVTKDDGMVKSIIMQFDME